MKKLFDNLVSPVSLACLAIVILASCRSKTSAPYINTIMGGRGKSGDLLVSGGNLVVHEGKLGVFFGTAKTPGSAEHFSYLIVFKHGRIQSEDNSLSHSGNCSCEGNRGTAAYTVTVNGKQIQAKHDIQLDEMGKVASESLSVGGKDVDVKAGRLFLIDLTADAPTYEQRDVELPDSLPAIESTKDVADIAGKVIDTLRPDIPDEFSK